MRRGVKLCQGAAPMVSKKKKLSLLKVKPHSGAMAAGASGYTRGGL